jgi:DNA (cytosine-5)-methyltransferase 1
MRLHVGSLFSGIGGFDLGLERAGMEIKWQVENNDYCRRVLRKHWPSVPCHYDSRSINWRDLPAVDLICAGFPCQPFSVAGKRRGSADNRSLWMEVSRCLTVLRPAWFLGENVPGFIKMALDQVCADLESLGYQVWPVCLPACAVDAPHIRQRIWIVAYHDGKRSKKQWKSVTNETAFLRNQWASQWPAEPGICRVVDGVPYRVDRLRGLGNSIVPQIAEALGRMILEAHEQS